MPDKNLPAVIPTNTLKIIVANIDELDFDSNFAISDQVDFDIVDAQVKKCKDVIKELDKIRKAGNKPYADSVKVNNAAFKVYTEKLTGFYRKGEQLMKDRRAIERAEAERLAAQAEKASASADSDDPLEMVVLPTQSTSSKSATEFRKVWNGDVKNLMLVVMDIVNGKAPISFVNINQSAVKAYANQYMEDARVQGIEFSFEEVVVSKS